MAGKRALITGLADTIVRARDGDSPQDRRNEIEAYKAMATVMFESPYLTAKRRASAT